MLEENKIVELNDEELERISGGYGKYEKITVEAGIYNDGGVCYYYLENNKTAYASSYITLKTYNLNSNNKLIPTNFPTNQVKFSKLASMQKVYYEFA